MSLQDLLKGKKKRVQRIGRGGKRGTTSGRGTKGQKSRAGRRIRPALRDLIIRIPKRRGFRNKTKSDKPAVLNLSDLKGKTKLLMGDSKHLILSRDILKGAKMIDQKFNGNIKLLGNGDIDFPMTVRGIEVSKSAKEKIEKAGGKIEAPANK